MEAQMLYWKADATEVREFAEKAGLKLPPRKLGPGSP